MVSLTLVGKAAGGRSGVAIGVYSFVVALGFMLALGAVKYSLEEWRLDWRSLWAGIGWSLVGLGIVAWPLVRLTASASETATVADNTAPQQCYTLSDALFTPAFWIFALASSYYGLVAAGISLFNQAILEERGLDRSVYLTIAKYSPLVGLASNLATGWLAERWSLPRLMALAMGLLMTSLATFPQVRTMQEVYLYAAVLGAVGGMITTLFFAVWSKAYGPAFDGAGIRGRPAAAGGRQGSRGVVYPGISMGCRGCGHTGTGGLVIANACAGAN